MQRRELGLGLADERRAGRVAAVAAEAPADVEHERVSLLDHPIPGLVMRARRVRTGRDDRESGRVVAGLEQELADVPAHLALRPPRQPLTHHRSHDGVGGDGRRPQAFDLVGILDPAQRAHRGTGSDQLGRVEGRSQAKRHARPHLVLHGHPARPGDDRLHQPDRVVGLIPGHDGHLIRQLAELMAGKRLLQARQDERRLAVGRNDEAGEPLERRSLISEEVGVVRGGCDQQHVDPSLGCLDGRAREAITVN